MLIKRLLVSNFRNLSYVDFSPAATFNIIYGKNGSGKTSILESISYLSLSRSFKKVPYQYLIQSGSKSFNIYAEIVPDNSEFPLKLGVSKDRGADTKILIDSKPVTRLTDLVDNISVQIIHPQSYELVTEGPELRRNYIDWGVYYHDQTFKSQWLDYRRILKQRNALLKSNASYNEIQVWDNMLVNLSDSINQKRSDYLKLLEPLLIQILSEFLPKYSFKFYMTKGHDDGTDLYSLLAQNIEKDRVLGYTFYGCHRADLKIKSNSVAAGAILSRGQLKLLVCAMRLAQGILLKQLSGINCIYLIDDLNSELDSNSQNILLSHLLKCRNQVFVTNITNDIVLPKSHDFNYFELTDGNIKNN